MFASFLAKGGEIDSGLALFDESRKITEDLAAQDPSNVLAAADVASGYLQLGNMLMEEAQYEPALARFREAFERYAPLVTADSSGPAAKNIQR